MNKKRSQEFILVHQWTQRTNSSNTTNIQMSHIRGVFLLLHYYHHDYNSFLFLYNILITSLYIMCYLWIYFNMALWFNFIIQLVSLFFIYYYTNKVIKVRQESSVTWVTHILLWALAGEEYNFICGSLVDQFFSKNNMNCLFSLTDRPQCPWILLPVVFTYLE